MLADLDPELAPPADRVRPLGDGRYELKAVIDADCQQGLEQLRGLLSHVDPRMTVGQLVGRIVQEALDRHDPSRPPRRARTESRAGHGESGPAPAANDQPAPEPDRAVTVQDAAIPAGPTPDGGAGAPPGADLGEFADPAGSDGAPGRCGDEAGRRRHFDAEAVRFGPRDSGGGTTTGVAAGTAAAAATSIKWPDAAATHDI